MTSRVCYFMAVYETPIRTKVSLTLPLSVVSWIDALKYAYERIPDGYDLQSLHFCTLDLPCDNQETLKENEVPAE